MLNIKDLAYLHQKSCLNCQRKAIETGTPISCTKNCEHFLATCKIKYSLTLQSLKWQHTITSINDAELLTPVASVSLKHAPCSKAQNKFAAAVLDASPIMSDCLSSAAPMPSVCLWTEAPCHSEPVCQEFCAIQSIDCLLQMHFPLCTIDFPYQTTFL